MNRPLWYGVGRALIVVSLLSACGSVTPKMPPEATGGTMPTTNLANRMPTPQEKFAMHSVENSYFGVTDTRRSLPLGLLLGPIGVAANMAHVRGESGTMAAELSVCLKRACGLYRAHFAGDLGPFRNYTIETTELTLYMPVYESSLPARVIGNDGIGLIELRRSGVRTLTPR